MHYLLKMCSSTLYVGLQHAVPPTNTKFKPLLHPTPAGLRYTNTSREHHISNLHSHFWVYLSGGSPLLPPDKKKRKFLRFLHHQCRVGTHSSTHQYKLRITFLLIIFNFKISSLSLRRDFSVLRVHIKLTQSKAIFLKYMLWHSITSAEVFRLIFDHTPQRSFT